MTIKLYLEIKEFSERTICKNDFWYNWKKLKVISMAYSSETSATLSEMIETDESVTGVDCMIKGTTILEQLHSSDMGNVAETIVVGQGIIID